MASEDWVIKETLTENPSRSLYYAEHGDTFYIWGFNALGAVKEVLMKLTRL